jgi:hypothetical protein
MPVRIRIIGVSPTDLVIFLGNVGRMAGIGTGRGPLYMDIPVEPRYNYIVFALHHY